MWWSNPTRCQMIPQSDWVSSGFGAWGLQFGSDATRRERARQRLPVTGGDRRATAGCTWCIPVVFCFPCGYSMDQYLLIPFLGGWTSIYQLFWCSPGVQDFDTLPCMYMQLLYAYKLSHFNSFYMFITHLEFLGWTSRESMWGVFCLSHGEEVIKRLGMEIFRRVRKNSARSWGLDAPFRGFISKETSETKISNALGFP